MIYLFLLLVGALGFAAQVALGFLHGSHGSHTNAANGHGGHGTAHSHSPVSAGHNTAHGEHSQSGSHHLEDAASAKSPFAAWPTWLSPLTFFSVALGAGVAGVLLNRFLSEPFLAAAAVVAGLLLNGAIVRPLMGLLLRFASEPATALKGSIAKSAEVVSRFDERGRGVVRLNVDGQVVRLLAELENEDKAQAATIKPGESLVVTSVDGKSNTCRVARM